jgi:hypothetical protein
MFEGSWWLEPTWSGARLGTGQLTRGDRSLEAGATPRRGRLGKRDDAKPQ